MKKLCFALLLTWPMLAQITYTAAKTTSLSSQTEVITIQATSSSLQTKFVGAYFDCSVACTLTLERNGTAASATALTINNVNPNEKTATVTAWSASNVGVGTVLATYSCQGACSLSVDLTGINFIKNAGTASNLTLRTTSMTGTVDIVIKFQETM